MTEKWDDAESMNLVTHFIAGYPSIEASFEIARGLIDGGAYALETQIPFSDPSADGPVIELACREALDAGFRVDEAFRLIRRIGEYSPIPLYVMSYSAIVFNMGIETFVERSASAGVAGLIIPDLIPGFDEGLYAAGRERGVDVVPVVVPGVTSERLDEIMDERPRWVYLALRGGITGGYTELGGANLEFLDRLKGYDVKVMAGFGIQTPEQVRLLQRQCDAAVVGSLIVNRITEEWTAGSGDLKRVYDSACSIVRYLLGKGELKG